MWFVGVVGDLVIIMFYGEVGVLVLLVIGLFVSFGFLCLVFFVLCVEGCVGV